MHKSVPFPWGSEVLPQESFGFYCLGEDNLSPPPLDETLEWVIPNREGMVLLVLWKERVGKLDSVCRGRFQG